MTLSTSPTVRSVTVPGARLHYEVRGAADFAARRGGPLVLVIGSPMASAEFAPLADALAGDHTVVTFDPRGYANSPVDDPDAQSAVEQRADDVTAILDDLGAESADVFGSSGGAVTGLALVARHPGRVRTLVAHEPPLLELLPDAAAAAREHRGHHRHVPPRRVRGRVDALHAQCRIRRFVRRCPAGTSAEPSDDEIRQTARFFDIDLRPTTQYLPDIDALKNSPTRVVIGIGADSGRLLTYRTSVALCELLGSTPVEFPGDHGGFLGAPTEFADTLRTVLS